jgi:hypothetical protein
MLPETMDQDSIQSFTPRGIDDAIEDIVSTQDSAPIGKSQKRKLADNVIDNGLDCECGVSVSWSSRSLCLTLSIACVIDRG